MKGNTMVKRKRTKRQAMFEKSLHTKRKIEQYESH